MKAAEQILSLASNRENLTNTPEELRDYDEATKAYKDLDAHIGRLREQRDREARAAKVNAGNGHVAADGGKGTAEARAHITNEPRVYGRGSGHSYFLDMARVDLN